MPLGQNQYTQYPTIPGVPSNNNSNSAQALPFSDYRGITPGVTGEGGVKAVNPFSFDFSNLFSNFLGGNVGQGAKPFDLSTFMPSTGTFSDPGQLTARVNPLLDALGQFFQTGNSNGIPGLEGLLQMSKNGMPTQFAQNGMPTDVGPAWEAMKAAQQRNIDQGAANVREQLSFAGNLNGTPFGNSINDYYTQAIKNQNADLTQATVAAQEAARTRQLGAQESAAGRQEGAQQMLFQGVNQLGQLFQGLDQQSIQNTLQEFLRTQPEYGPLLNMMFALATTFAPQVNTKTGQGILGQIGSLIQGGGEAAAEIAALCWTARSAYGENDPRWRIVRKFIFTPRSFEHCKLAIWYLLNGKKLAAAMEQSPRLKREVRGYLDNIVDFALA